MHDWACLHASAEALPGHYDHDWAWQTAAETKHQLAVGEAEDMLYVMCIVIVVWTEIHVLTKVRCESGRARKVSNSEN
jgi:hypothetical protein